ncbi:MAG TPA: hypothetical protein VFW78_00730 [Bacteroidia bacterium]|nr:hypothetical protein [Bacteroidia bacterium]
MIYNGKATVDKTAGGININIPSKKNWFVLLFGTAWLGGWYWGFKNVSSMLFKGTEQPSVDGFITFWLLAWTFSGVAIILMLLWGYFGQEKFFTDRGLVYFEKTVFGIGAKNKLEINGVNNFRTEFGNDSIWGGNRYAVWGLGPGKIKFDYGMKTYSFGQGVDDAEAQYLVGLLKDYFKEN